MLEMSRAGDTSSLRNLGWMLLVPHKRAIVCCINWWNSSQNLRRWPRENTKQKASMQLSFLKWRLIERSFVDSVTNYRKGSPNWSCSSLGARTNRTAVGETLLRLWPFSGSAALRNENEQFRRWA